jgi:hypothetical protein
MLVPQVVDKCVSALARDGTTARYGFDTVFGPTADSQDVLAKLPSTVRMAMAGYTTVVFMLFVMDRDGITSAAASAFDTVFDEVLALKSNVVEHVRQPTGSAAMAAAQEVAAAITTINAAAADGQLLKFRITASFVAIQENVVHDLTPASHDHGSSGSSNSSSRRNRDDGGGGGGGGYYYDDADDDDDGGSSNPDRPLGREAHATVVQSKADCRRHFESGLERYMRLVKSRGWAMCVRVGAGVHVRVSLPCVGFVKRFWL